MTAGSRTNGYLRTSRALLIALVGRAVCVLNPLNPSRGVRAIPQYTDLNSTGLFIERNGTS